MLGYPCIMEFYRMCISILTIPMPTRILWPKSLFNVQNTNIPIMTISLNRCKCYQPLHNSYKTRIDCQY